MGSCSTSWFWAPVKWPGGLYSSDLLGIFLANYEWEWETFCSWHIHQSWWVGVQCHGFQQIEIWPGHHDIYTKTLSRLQIVDIQIKSILMHSCALYSSVIIIKKSMIALQNKIVNSCWVYKVQSGFKLLDLFLKFR